MFFMLFFLAFHVFFTLSYFHVYLFHVYHFMFMFFMFMFFIFIFYVFYVYVFYVVLFYFFSVCYMFFMSSLSLFFDEQVLRTGDK